MKGEKTRIAYFRCVDLQYILYDSLLIATFQKRNMSLPLFVLLNSFPICNTKLGSKVELFELCRNMYSAEKIKSTLESLRVEDADKQIARAFLEESKKVSLFKEIIPDDGSKLVLLTINEKTEIEYNREESSSSGIE